jgi:cytidylate kinase
MPFQVWTVPLSLAALVAGLVIGWFFGRRSARALALPVLRGFGAALALGLLGVVLLIIFEPLLPKEVDAPAHVLFFVALGLNLAVNAAPAVLAATLGFGLGGRLARIGSTAPRSNGEGIRAMIIAIDGPAASGKGTLAKRVAEHYGIPCLDTGLLYRAVARDVARLGFRLDDIWAAVAAARGLDPRTLDDPALRGANAGDAASIVAKIPEVRAALLDYQRAFARRKPGAVLDGRDIGTVVCPDADVKIYVTASPEVRAKRRFTEFEARGDAVTFEAVLAVIKERDARDAGRADAPMVQAPDAILLDTTDLGIEAAFDAAVGLIKRKIGH